MDKTVKRYYELKRRQKEIELELADLRERLLEYGANRESTVFEVGGYRVKMIAQERREYDDEKLYKALPDADVWKLLSRADAAKIAAMLKLGVISEETLRGTYSLKQVSLLQVERK